MKRNRRLKKIVFSCLFAFIYGLSSWSQPLSREQVSNELAEITKSFMDNPYNHSNTVRINERADKLKGILDHYILEVPSKAEIDYSLILKMRKIVRCLYFITASVSNNTSGLESEDVETILNPLFDSYGWTWRVIHATEEIVFYEYKKDKFKMLLAKNILPKKDSSDYYVAYSCEEWDKRKKRFVRGIRRIVEGGYYQFVMCGDDSKEYIKFNKFLSKRGSNLDVFE